MTTEEKIAIKLKDMTTAFLVTSLSYDEIIPDFAKSIAALCLEREKWIPVKLLQDGDGNFYLIPNELSERFEQLQVYQEDHQKATQLFIDEFSQYLQQTSILDNEIQLFVSAPAARMEGKG